MQKDPKTQWEDGFPYDHLTPAGVDFDSSLAEIREASFALMQQKAMGPKTRQAWDALRRPQNRLEVDFFLLQDVDAAALLEDDSGEGGKGNG